VSSQSNSDRRDPDRPRWQLLGEVMAPLGAEEGDTLAALAGRMLVGMMREPGATRWICRLLLVEA
jgi:hypothetical protein